MTNPLTGEFDVAAELSVAAINRVLAAQHQVSGDDQMYFHSVRIRVPAGADHGVSGAVDVQVSPPAISLPPGGPLVVGVDPPAATAALAPNALSPFELSPAALAPTLIHPGGAAPPWLPAPSGGSRVTIHFRVMARFRPDAHSADAPAFVHGEARATVDAEQITSTTANVLAVDLGAADVAVSFTADSGTQLSPANLDLVSQVVRELVRGSFEPVNHVIQLPTGTDGFAPYHWRMKTMPDDVGPGVVILLTMSPERVPTDADRDAFDSGALGAGNDFAVAVSADFLIPTLRELIRRQIQDHVVGSTVKIKRTAFRITLVNITYEIRSAAEPVVELHPGAVKLRVSFSTDGTGFPSPKIDVALEQAFTLAAVAGSVRLQRVGEVGVEVDVGGGPAGWIVSLFRGRIKSMIREKANDALDSVVSEAAPALEEMLSGLETLLADVRIPAPELSYRAIDIVRDGIIVHGDLTITDWDPVVVSFASRTAPGSKLELDAFDSWIPGGTVERFQWRFGDGTTVQQVIDHEHQFIAHPDKTGPSQQHLSLWSQWCLEVRGTQNGVPVSGSNCDLVGPPVVVPTEDGGDDEDGNGSVLPISVLDEAGRVVAHVDLSSPPPDDSGRPAAVWPANVLIHFAGSDPASTAVLVGEALPNAEVDGELLVVSVFEPGSLERVQEAASPDLPGAAIAFAEDFEGSWARRFGVESVGGAYLLNPQKGILWHSAYGPSAQDLSAALSSHAVPVPLPPAGRLRVGVRTGVRAPDFLFDYGADTTMSLRALHKQPVMITFFKSWSEPCRHELARLQERQEELAAEGWVVLAVSDGEMGVAAERVVEELGLRFRVLADPNRQIAREYGVRAWPTTVMIDAQGVVRQVRTGARAQAGPAAY